MVATWPRCLKRLRESCPRFVQRMRNTRGTDSAKRLVVLLRALNGLVPDLEAEPTQQAREAVLRALREGRFGRRATVRRLLLAFAPVPVHPALQRLFDEPLRCTDEEEQLFLHLTRQGKTQRERMLYELNQLRSLERLEQEPPLWQLGQVPLTAAARFCSKGGRVAEMRLRLLLLTGFAPEQEQALREQVAALAAEERHVRALWRRHEQASTSKPKLRLRMYWQLVDRLCAARQGGLRAALRHLTAEELLAAVKPFGRAQTHLVAVLAELAREEGLHALQQRLTEARLQKRELCARKSTFHAQLLQQALDRERRNPRAAFAERHVRSFTSRFACFVLALDAHAEAAVRSWSAAGVEDSAPALRRFLARASAAQLGEAVRSLAAARDVHNQHVKSPRHLHSAKQYVATCLRFLKLHLRAWLCAAEPELHRLTVQSVLETLPNRRVCADATARRTFTDEEVDSMLRLARDPAERLLLMLLQQVALRNSALGHLKYHMLLDATHAPREVCSVPEKGRTLRAFPTSPSLRAAVQELAAHWRERVEPDLSLPDVYVLNLANPRRPVALATIHDKLRRLAREAGITGVVVHAHAFRHTLVTKLLNVGNSLGIVAKYMGHADTSTTSYFYWLPSAHDLQQNMKNPFAPDYHQQQLQEREHEVLLQAAEHKLSACRQLLDLAVRSPEYRALLDAARPNWRSVLRCVDEAVDEAGDEVKRA